MAKKKRTAMKNAVAKKRSETDTKSTADNESTRLGFLDLPSEIRLQIYRLIFTNPVYPLAAGYTLRDKQPVHMFVTRLSAQLFRTCKTIYNEAHPVLYGINSFLLQESSEFDMLRTAAGHDTGLITELSFQPGCKLTKPRIKKLQAFSGLKTIILSYSHGHQIHDEDKIEIENDAARYIEWSFKNAVDCVRARPDLNYRFRIKHSKKYQEVIRRCLSIELLLTIARVLEMFNTWRNSNLTLLMKLLPNYRPHS